MYLSVPIPLSDGVPYDGVPDTDTATINPFVTVTYFVLVTAGISFTVFCLVFNFIFRNKKLVYKSLTDLTLFAKSLL